MKKVIIIIALFLMSNSLFSSELLKSSESRVEVKQRMPELFTYTPDVDLLFKGIEKSGGKYSISLTSEYYLYNGKKYDIYEVNYEHYSIKIGVAGDSFVLLGDDHILFYKYTKNNFGIYKVLFNNKAAQDKLNIKEYSNQTKLLSDRKSISETIVVISENYPLLRNV